MKLEIYNDIVTLPKDSETFYLDSVCMHYALMPPNIDVQYVFEQTIDTDILKKSLIELIKDMPALAGRLDFKAMQVSTKNNGIPFIIVDNYPGCAKEYGQLGSVIQKNRRKFTITPEANDIFSGKGSLMGIKVTNFAEGGCILGITIAHVLVDAYGHCLLVKRLSDIFMEIKEGTYSTNSQREKIILNRPLFEFGKNRDKKTLALDMEKLNLIKPMAFDSFIGLYGLRIQSKLFKYIRKTDREVIHFTKEQTERLKEVVTKESGESWVTTYQAFCSHFVKIMAELSNTKTNKMQILTIGDLRRFANQENKDVSPSLFARNAIMLYTIHAKFDRPYVGLSRGEIASSIKRELSKINTWEHIKANMDCVYDCLSLGYSYPVGTNMKQPFTEINSQTKLPAYDVNFSNKKPLRVIPQEVADSVLVYPDGNGGVEVYIRDYMHTKRQKKLLTDEWQDKIFSF